MALNYLVWGLQVVAFIKYLSTFMTYDTLRHKIHPARNENVAFIFIGLSSPNIKLLISKNNRFIFGYFH